MTIPKNKPTHSPLPWTYNESSCRINSSEQDEYSDGLKSVFNLYGACGGEDSTADIKLVLTAVNHHEKLLEALKLLLEHEGERQVDGIGIEHDSRNLENAKRLACQAIEEASKP